MALHIRKATALLYAELLLVSGQSLSVGGRQIGSLKQGVGAGLSKNHPSLHPSHFIQELLLCRQNGLIQIRDHTPRPELYIQMKALCQSLADRQKIANKVSASSSEQQEAVYHKIFDSPSIVKQPKSSMVGYHAHVYYGAISPRAR